MSRFKFWVVICCKYYPDPRVCYLLPRAWFKEDGKAANSVFYGVYVTTNKAQNVSNKATLPKKASSSPRHEKKASKMTTRAHHRTKLIPIGSSVTSPIPMKAWGLSSHVLTTQLNEKINVAYKLLEICSILARFFLEFKRSNPNGSHTTIC